MARKKPIAFMSYVRSDDEHESGRLTEFRKQLSAEVRMQTGEEFPIFQDRNAIKWGQNWKERIDESLDDVTFLIPIITPSFFKSPACRDEVERFLKREKELKRNDLILPIYYVDAPLLNDRKKRATDKLAKVIAKRQYADWRDLRFEPFTSLKVSKAMAALAVQMRDALEQRVVPEKLKAKRPKAKKRKRKGAKTSEAAEGIESVSAGETKKGPSARTEPPTRIVDPMHRADYVTISEAIKAANPGDRIIVRPGFYQEGLVIDKPLEIIGEGEPGEVVIQAEGKDSILFETTMGRVANLTIRQMGGGDFYGVDISQGRLKLEDCDITSQSFACVAIHGSADPILRRNRIHDGKQGGIFVYENGQGTLEDNDIFGNALAGVTIKEGGNPTLRRNRIHDSKGSGVNVYDSGQGTLEDNDIFGNRLVGVGISEGGNPILRRNRIHDGKGSGVNIYKNGQGTLEDNDIFGNGLAGVGISEGGNPTLRRNRIYENKESNGVVVYDNGEGTLEDNDIFGNGLAGVGISEGGNPTLRRNRIHDGKTGGVLVYENGQGTLEDNDIFGNKSTGVTISEGGNPTLRRNRIHKNGYQAIWIYDDGGGTFEDNDLRDNPRGAWDIDKSSLSKVKRTNNLE